MKIGILTFHWATNYGAILQAFALQAYLKSIGHDVKIINYKPARYDDTLYYFFRYRKFLQYRTYRCICRKESFLKSFRSRHLIQTQRFSKEQDLTVEASMYDILITGSDQVLNPFFLQSGERGGSTAYFLGFTNTVKKISYAASFGCTEYPVHLREKIKSLLTSFHAISVREVTGQAIVASLGFKDVELVPDPTLLLSADSYKVFVTCAYDEHYFAYMLHGEQARLDGIVHKFDSKINKSTDECIENWLSNIYNSKGVITNSFHCVVFSLLFHKPFIVLLNQLENKGMNDRFYTILEKCGLISRISTYEEFNQSLMNMSIDWDKVDKVIDEIRTIGKNFLEENL